MWFGVITLHPELFALSNSVGVFARAQREGIVELATANPRDFAQDRHHSVDDPPYGGGDGMLMMVPPLVAALTHLQALAPAPCPVVMLSPQGRVVDQTLVAEQAQTAGAILVCGRFEGVDQRFVDAYVDTEWSVGDVVLSGGELPALLVMDAIVRLLPGALGNPQSAINHESHLDGLLEYPQYTRPETVDEMSVPAVLLSGHHQRIEEYRRREALQRTFERRPDLLTGRQLSKQDRKLLREMFADGSLPSGI